MVWYDFALSQRDQDHSDAHYGIALCCIKNGNVDKALIHIEKALKLNQDKEDKEDDIHLTYLKALCLKILKRNDQADTTYASMAKRFSREEGRKIAKYIFGMILMPLESNRKVKIISVNTLQKIMEYVEGFAGILDQYESQYINRKKLIQHSIEAIDQNNSHLKNINIDKKWRDD